eukprot:scpid96927/ scgid29344/ 
MYFLTMVHVRASPLAVPSPSAPDFTSPAVPTSGNTPSTTAQHLYALDTKPTKVCEFSTMNIRHNDECYFPEGYLHPRAFPSKCGLTWGCSLVVRGRPEEIGYRTSPPAILEVYPKEGRQEDLEECDCSPRVYDQLVVVIHSDGRKELGYRRTKMGYRHCRNKAEKCRQFTNACR